MVRTPSKLIAVAAAAESQSSGLSSVPPSPVTSHTAAQSPTLSIVAEAVRYALPIHDIGNVTAPAGVSQVQFRVRQEDNRDWNTLLERFRTGHRIQATPNRSGNRDGLCGAFALWMGFRHLARVNGWLCPPFSRLLQFLTPTNNPAYWEFVFDEAPSLPAGFLGYMDDDYLPENWFSYQQLDMAARWLGQEFGEGTNLRIVYVTQERSRRHVHDLMMGWPTYDDTAQVIFVHHTPGNTRDGLEDHYQAIVPESVGNVEAETGRARCDNQAGPSHSTTRASNTRNYVNHGAGIPRGDKLLYLNGQLGQNPVTGVAGRIGTPLQTTVIQRRLHIYTSGILAHSAKQARDRYGQVSWPAPGERASQAPTRSDDLATKLQKRLDSPSRDPSRSASPVPRTSPPRKPGLEVQPQTVWHRILPTSMADHITQTTDNETGVEPRIADHNSLLDIVNDWRTDQRTLPYQRWTHVVPRSPYPPPNLPVTEPCLSDPYPEALLEDYIANARPHLHIAFQQLATPLAIQGHDGEHSNSVPTETGGGRDGPRRSQRIIAQRATHQLQSISKRKRNEEPEHQEDESAPATLSKRQRTSGSFGCHQGSSGGRLHTPVITIERAAIPIYPRLEQTPSGPDLSANPPSVPSAQSEAHINTLSVSGGRLLGRRRDSITEAEESHMSLSPPNRLQRPNVENNGAGDASGMTLETEAAANQLFEMEDNFGGLFEPGDVGTAEGAGWYPVGWAPEHKYIYEDDGGPGRAPRSPGQQTAGTVPDAADDVPALEPGRYYEFENNRGHRRPIPLSEPQRRSRSIELAEERLREVAALAMPQQRVGHGEVTTVDENACGHSSPNQSEEEELQRWRLAKAKLENYEHMSL